MGEEIIRDIAEAKAKAKKWGPILLGGALAAGVPAALMYDGPGDQWPLIVMVVAGLFGLVGAILSVNGFMPADRNPLVIQLREDPTAISRVEVVRILRNGYHGTTRLTFFTEKGKVWATEVPKAQAETWLQVLMRELPGLQVG